MSSPIVKTPVLVSDALRIVRLRVASGAVVPEHHANVDVVVTVVQGRGRFSVDGKEREIGPGDVIAMPPKAPHSIAAASDLELVVVHARLASSGAAPDCGA